LRPRFNKLTEEHQPDLLIIEPFLGHYDGIFLLKELAARFPRTRILAVSRQPEDLTDRELHVFVLSGAGLTRSAIRGLT
jgi:response regulator of citrate/malate metabolism